MCTHACLAEPRGVIHTVVCGFGFVSHTAKALQGTNGFLWDLTEGLPTVPTRSNTLLEALAASSLLRAELRLPRGISQDLTSCWDPTAVYLGFLCLDSTIPAVPLCLCLPSPSQTELPGFSWNTLSVLVLPVPNCWQRTCFDFIFLGPLDPSFGQKSPGISGPLLLPPSFAPSHVFSFVFPVRTHSFKYQHCLASSAPGAPLLCVLTF